MEFFCFYFFFSFASTWFVTAWLRPQLTPVLLSIRHVDLLCYNRWIWAYQLSLVGGRGKRGRGGSKPPAYLGEILHKEVSLF